MEGLAVRLTCRVVALCLGASLAFLAVGSPAAAAPKRISGRLSKSGYTVIALAANGRAKAVRVRRHGFRLRPPARSVTLQLRAPDGKYAGPIVIGRRGTYAIVGVRAGATLGRVRIDARRGYARLARRLPRRWRDPSRLARTRRGVPFGARNYGFVRSRRIRSAAAARSGPGRDRDSDGVPDALDVAAGGDLVFNHFKRSRRARGAQAGSPFVLGGFFLGDLDLDETVNANALPALTREQLAGLMDATLVRHGSFDFGDDNLRQKGFELELDCRGRIYCAPHSRGGTGQLTRFDPDRSEPFPDCCDPDGDGLGAFAGPGALGLDYSTIVPGAGTAQIGSGDELIWRLTKVPRGFYLQPGDYPTTLQFVFASTPALVSYSDTAGHSATVPYPVSAGGPGTHGNGFPVSAGPDGEIKVTLTLWRPERAPIAPNPGTGLGGDACYPDCQWVDIGRLVYMSVINFDYGDCPPSALSTTDPNLAVVSAGRPAGHNPGFLSDSTPDRGADPRNTVSYTLNFSDCLRDLQVGDGSPPGPLSWNPGEELELGVRGLTSFTPPTDNTEQRIFFQRQ